MATQDPPSTPPPPSSSPSSPSPPSPSPLSSPSLSSNSTDFRRKIIQSNPTNTPSLSTPLPSPPLSASFSPSHSQSLSSSLSPSLSPSLSFPLPISLMVSYAWGEKKHQFCSRKIANDLKKVFLSVWLDVDQMKGNLLDAMAQAITEADVVLLFTDKKYEDSDNCRAEAQYTRSQKKPFVPLVYGDFTPSPGWLSFLFGAQKYIKIDTDMKENEREEMYEELIKEILYAAGKRASHEEIEEIVREMVTPKPLSFSQVERNLSYSSSLSSSLSTPSTPNRKRRTEIRSPTARDFTLRISDALRLSPSTTTTTNNNQQQLETLLQSCQNTSQNLFSRSHYFKIINECTKLYTNPVSEFLSMSSAISEHLKNKTSLSSSPSPLSSSSPSSSIPSLSSLPLPPVHVSLFLDGEIIENVTDFSLTIGRETNNTLIIPTEKSSLSRVQTIVFSILTEVGAIFVILDPGSKGGMKMKERRGGQRKGDREEGGMKSVLPEILPEKGGIFFCSAFEEVEIELGNEKDARLVIRGSYYEEEEENGVHSQLSGDECWGEEGSSKSLWGGPLGEGIAPLMEREEGRKGKKGVGVGVIQKFVGIALFGALAGYIFFRLIKYPWKKENSTSFRIPKKSSWDCLTQRRM